MKVLITGANGRLGSELAKLFPGAYTEEFEILDVAKGEEIIKKVKPDVIIHCAAMTDVCKCEKDPLQCYLVNSLGTFSIASLCYDNHIKLVYIGTDHVFDGTLGYYDENDIPNPQGIYAKSKLIGEYYALADKNNLVIRTSFMKDFPFERAYIDKYFNAEKVASIANMIKQAVMLDLHGIYHIAGEPKSVYVLAKQFNKNVKRMELKDRPVNSIGMPYLKDTSLNIDKWRKACKR
jgi:dTDP-4-dehydrorhamnose reductase